MSIPKLIYDGIATTTPTTFRYKWAIDKNNTYTLFAMHALTNTTEVEAHYRPKKGVTILMAIPVDIDDNDMDDNCDTRSVKTKLTGFVIVGLKTNKGSVGINY